MALVIAGVLKESRDFYRAMKRENAPPPRIRRTSYASRNVRIIMAFPQNKATLTIDHEETFMISAKWTMNAFIRTGEHSADVPAPACKQENVMKSNTKVDLDVTGEVLDMAISGWSVRKDILGKEVLNDNHKHIGTIEDLLVTRDKAFSYAIIGLGGFFGMGRYDVAVPLYKLRMDREKLTLSWATKASLKTLPPFKHK